MTALYYYEGQRATVELAFAELLIDRRALRQVHKHGDEIRGVQPGLFVIVMNHPNPIPRELSVALREQGWTFLLLDDSYARARATQRGDNVG